MSKLSALKPVNWRSHELINPVLGSSNNIQPKVVTSGGKKKEIQKPNSKALAKRILVREMSQDRKMPKGSATTCRTMPILTLFHSERQIPGSLKASRHALSP